PGRHRRGCIASEHPRIGRRQLLEAGGMSLLGFGLADLLRLEAHAQVNRPSRATAKSVVFIFQSGGPSQHETWDPKPLAPAEIRGDYGTTATRTAGFHICEYLPQLAQRTDRYSVVRTMHHTAGPQFRNEHSASMYMVQSGRCELPPGETTQSIAVPRARRFEWPSIGSAIDYALPGGGSLGLPNVVEIPRAGGTPLPGSGPGMLGNQFARWRVDLAPVCRTPDGGGSCPNCFAHDQPNDPARVAGKQSGAWWDNSSCRDAAFHLPDLGLSSSVSLAQLENRSVLLKQLDVARRNRDTLEGAASDNLVTAALDTYRQRAWELILGQHGKHNPFDLTNEPDQVRDLYGREEWGQAFLVARRLVEAGVRMVQINLRGWDTHQNAFRDLKGHLLPSIDRTLSGFLNELEASGLLAETLVVMCGEMGRTPRISPISTTGKNTAGEPFSPGRHHWGDVFPCFFAGGGVQPGRVIGQSDRQAGLPVSEAYTPADLAATIFHCLGIDREQEFFDAEHRPYRIYQGEPIAALL
ncbi:MAG TPA: DUF1501 domain-containing protein, partial [Pirellulales bacterium]